MARAADVAWPGFWWICHCRHGWEWHGPGDMGCRKKNENGEMCSCQRFSSDVRPRALVDFGGVA